IGIRRGDDTVDRFHAAHRANAAGRALAAGFDRAEFHREARHLRHVHRTVEYDNATVAEHAADLDELFIVERCVEQLSWQVGAERATDLHCTYRLAGSGAATE